MNNEESQVLATLIGSSCQMYDTSARLFHEGRIQDSNSLAAKAKTLLNKALLEAGINEPSVTNSDIMAAEDAMIIEERKHWENAITSLRKFKRGDLLSEDEKISLKSVNVVTFGAMFPSDIDNLKTAGLV